MNGYLLINKWLLTYLRMHYGRKRCRRYRHRQRFLTVACTCLRQDPDFDFIDKAAVVGESQLVDGTYLDDEDLQNDETGSTTDAYEEGSGAAPTDKAEPPVFPTSSAETGKTPSGISVRRQRIDISKIYRLPLSIHTVVRFGCLVNNLCILCISLLG